MVCKSFDELVARLRGQGETKRVAVAGCGAVHVLEAVVRAAQQRIAQPVLFGDRDKTRQILRDLGAEAWMDAVVHCETPEEAVLAAIRCVNEGGADFVMKGLVETGTLMKAMLNRENGFRVGDGIVSNATFAEIETYHKILALTDGAVALDPTLEQKKRIVESTVSAMRRMGWERPKVGVLAAVETVNPKMPATLEADALKQMWLRGEIADCVLEGPISLDLALDRESARTKGFESEVAGDADLLLFPDLASGNIGIKMLTVTGHNKTGSVILGLRTPVVMSSRGSTTDNKLRSLLLASAMA